MKLRARILALQEYRRMGLRSIAESTTYEKEKQIRLTAKSNAAQAYPSLTIPVVPRQYMTLKIPPSYPAPLELEGQEGLELLSIAEKDLCSKQRMLPKAYLAIKDTLIREYQRAGVIKRARARTLIRLETPKLYKFFEFFIEKGWISECGSGNQSNANSNLSESIRREGGLPLDDDGELDLHSNAPMMSHSVTPSEKKPVVSRKRTKAGVAGSSKKRSKTQNTGSVISETPPLDTFSNLGINEWEGSCDGLDFLLPK